jgi:hypothetical protein
MSGITAASFDRESIEALNLITIAQNIKDKDSSSSLSSIVTIQDKNLKTEVKELEKQLKELQSQANTHERDFIDQRREKGEVIKVISAATTMQDGVLNFFAFSYFLCIIVFIYLSFLPPLGNNSTGMRSVAVSLLLSIIVWVLIYKYA